MDTPVLTFTALWRSAGRVVMVTLAVLAAPLFLSAMADADMTVSASADTGVSHSGCSWTATLSTSNVNLSELQTCLGSGSSGAQLTDNVSAGGNIVFNTAFSAPGCANNATLQLTDGSGNVDFNAPVTIGGGSCAIQTSTPSGGVSQASGDVLTVPKLFFQPTNGTAVSLGEANQIGAIGGDPGGACTIVDNQELTIDTLSCGGQILLEDPVGIGVAGSLTSGSSIDLIGGSSATPSGSVTEATGASIKAPGLGVLAISAQLIGSNDVGLVTVKAYTNVTFDDASAGGLTLAQEVVAPSLTVTNTGGIQIDTPTTFPLGNGSGDGTVSLTSTSGSITEASAGVIALDSLAVSAPNGAVSLSGTNQYTGLSGNAGAGGITATDADSSPLTLGALSASGAVNVNDTAAQIDLGGQVSGSAINLSGTRIAGSGGSLSAPTIVLGASASGDTWALTSGSVTDGPELPIAFSGASSVAVDATGTFNLTASPMTAFTVNGGTSVSSTLNYDAQGRTVSGSTSAPSGVIDSPTVQPVNFSGMKAVNLANVGTTQVAATVTPVVQVASPNCTLRAPSLRAVTPKVAHSKGKATKPSTFKLVATCTGAGSLKLAGSVSVTAVGKAGHRSKAKRYPVSVVLGKLAGSGSATLVVDLPAAAAKALAAHGTGTASFTLSATNSGGTGTASLQLAPL